MDTHIVTTKTVSAEEIASATASLACCFFNDGTQAELAESKETKGTPTLSAFVEREVGAVSKGPQGRYSVGGRASSNA